LTDQSLLIGQGNAFLELMEIPNTLRSEKAAKSIYLLLCHKKVSLRQNCIRSDYIALFRGCLKRIRMPYYSVFFKTCRQTRKKFFEEELIRYLWSRFCKEEAWVFEAILKVD
jgi:hypothetical protein